MELQREFMTTSAIQSNAEQYCLIERPRLVSTKAKIPSLCPVSEEGRLLH